MRIDKKKIVFVSIVVLVLIFIVSYSILVMAGDAPAESLDQTQVPELEEVQEIYETKLEALDALKEEREKFIPSVYPESMLDSMGYYDPELDQKLRERKIDSLFVETGKASDPKAVPEPWAPVAGSPVNKIKSPEISIQDFAAGHERFFLTGELPNPPGDLEAVQEGFLAQVNGRQRVQAKDRLELILLEPILTEGVEIPRNSLLYGFVSLQENRVQVLISHVQGKKIALKAYDLQDGNPGIHVRNSFRAAAGKEVIGQLAQDVNLPGFPQIGGLKNLFRRNHRKTKVTIMDGYKLILKPTL